MKWSSLVCNQRLPCLGPSRRRIQHMLQVLFSVVIVLILSSILSAAPRLTQEEFQEKARALTAMAAGPNIMPEPGLGVFCNAQELQRIRKEIQDPNSLTAAYWQQLLEGVLKGKGHYTQDAFIYLVTGDEEARGRALSAFGTIPSYTDAEAWRHWGQPVLPMFDTEQPRYYLTWLDFMWSALDEEARKESVANLAQALRYNWRFGILAEGHSMLHPRLHTNQAFTYVGSWLMTAAALRPHIPDGQRIYSTILQTYLWMANLLGDPGGGDLVREDAGYFTCGLCGWLGAAETCLRLTGVNLYKHPFMRNLSRRESLYTGVVRPYTQDGGRMTVSAEDHLTTCMVWGDITKKQSFDPRMRFALPAQRLGDPDSCYWWRRMGFEDGKPTGQFHGAHLGKLGPIMGVTWTNLAEVPEASAPAVPDFHVSKLLGYVKYRTGTKIGDLLAMIGSDYFFLEAYDESLIAGQNGGWHMPLFSLAEGRSTVLVEDQPQAITRMLEEVFVFGGIEMIKSRLPVDSAESFLGAHGSTSTEWSQYRRRDRMVVFLRPDYFVVLDDVQLAKEDDKRRMELQWMYNILGRSKVEIDRQTNTIHLERPLADLDTHVAYPDDVNFDERTIEMQEVGRTSYASWDGIRAVRIGQPAPAINGIETMLVDWATFKPEKIYTTSLQLSDNPKEAKEHIVKITTIKDSWDACYRCVPVPIRGGVLYEIRTAFRKKGMFISQNAVTSCAKNPSLAWYVTVTYQEKDGKKVGQENLHIVKPRQEDCEWTELKRRLSPPPSAKTMQIAIRLWDQRKGDVTPAELWLKPFTLKPAPQNIRRMNAAQYLTILVPKRKDEESAKVDSRQIEDATIAHVAFRGLRDTWLYNQSGKAVTFDKNIRSDGKLSLVRTGPDESTAVSLFYGKELHWDRDTKGAITIEADAPVLISLDTSNSGAITGKIRTFDLTTVQLRMDGIDDSLKLPEAGFYLISMQDKKWIATTNENPLELSHTTGAESIDYAEALRPLTDLLLADQRDNSDLVNYAPKATVTASASYDKRFAPEHVIDGEVIEYGREGRVEFDLGSTTIMPHQLGWYSGQDRLPLRVRPTYWLLPDGEPGSITLILDKTRILKRIRLLNTQNQGANDRAAVNIRVVITDTDGTSSEVYKGAFGTPLGAEAFGFPPYPNDHTWGNTWFSEIPVPLYLGFLSIDLPGNKLVRSVTVHIDSFWGRGGGLNEIQLLGPG